MRLRKLPQRKANIFALARLFVFCRLSIVGVGSLLAVKAKFCDILDAVGAAALCDRLLTGPCSSHIFIAYPYLPRFVAKVQNKLHCATHGRMAAKIIRHRVDAQQEHRGLIAWKGASRGKIQRYDATVAKNYLTQDELASLACLVNAYLDFAELRAGAHIPLTTRDEAEIFMPAQKDRHRKLVLKMDSLRGFVKETQPKD